MESLEDHLLWGFKRDKILLWKLKVFSWIQRFHSTNGGLPLVQGDTTIWMYLLEMEHYIGVPKDKHIKM